MLDLVRLSSNDRFRTRHGASTGARSAVPLRSGAMARRFAPVLWLAIAAAGLGIHHLAGEGAFSRLFAGALAPTAEVATDRAADTLTVAFTLCGSGRRIDCVVDGDTFWHHGVKIRMADIDTPELSPPRCEAERVKGEAAKRRLQALLNAGPFSLSSGRRDEDRYGRKLRTVRRGDASLGDTLIAEGLARRWDGARHPWCG